MRHRTSSLATRVFFLLSNRAPWIVWFLFAAGPRCLVAANPGPDPFYVPENTNYTIVQSAIDSVEFTLAKTLMRKMALRCAQWIDQHVADTPNGWYPRRTDPNGSLHRNAPHGNEDPYWQTSADVLFILQLQAGLTSRSLADYSVSLKRKSATFVSLDRGSRLEQPCGSETPYRSGPIWCDPIYGTISE